MYLFFFLIQGHRSTDFCPWALKVKSRRLFQSIRMELKKRNPWNLGAKQVFQSPFGWRNEMMSYLLISDCLHRNHLCWLCRIMDGSESTQVYNFWWRTRYSNSQAFLALSLFSFIQARHSLSQQSTRNTFRVPCFCSVGEGGQSACEQWTWFQLLISAPKEVKQEDVVENEVGHGASTTGIESGKAWLTWPRSTEPGRGISETGL